MSEHNVIKKILIIAGSDSIGGAGIQADIKTSCAYRTYAMTAVTAVTAQNTRGVQAVASIKPDMIFRQIESVVNDCRPDAVKIGMAGDAENIKTIADAIGRFELPNVVVDPVLVASSGDSLSGGLSECIQAYYEYLFPLADLITPNIPEAVDLLGISEGFEDPGLMAVRLLGMTKAKAVLVKGGHGVKEECRDWLLYHTNDGIRDRQFVAPRIETPNTHGTGCTLSTAIACGLAEGLPLPDAIDKAKHFISKALEGGRDLRLGHGTGPLDFFVSP